MSLVVSQYLTSNSTNHPILLVQCSQFEVSPIHRTYDRNNVEVQHIPISAITQHQTVNTSISIAS